MDLITQRQNFKHLEGEMLFGNLDLLNPDKFSKTKSSWGPCYIYALTKCKVISLNYEKTYAYMEKFESGLKE